MEFNQEIDIAKNIRVIEWLKAELVGGVSGLFKAMLKGGEELILDGLATVVMTSYVLGKRLGISFAKLDHQVETKVKQKIKEDHEVEKWYGDLSALLHYLENKKR